MHVMAKRRAFTWIFHLSPIQKSLNICLFVCGLFIHFYSCWLQSSNNNSIRANVYPRISPKQNNSFSFLQVPNAHNSIKGIQHSGRFSSTCCNYDGWASAHKNNWCWSTWQQTMLSCHFEFRMLEHFSHNKPNTWTGEQKKIAKQLHSISLFLVNSLLFWVK